MHCKGRVLTRLKQWIDFLQHRKCTEFVRVIIWHLHVCGGYLSFLWSLDSSCRYASLELLVWSFTHRFIIKMRVWWFLQVSDTDNPTFTPSSCSDYPKKSKHWNFFQALFYILCTNISVAFIACKWLQHFHAFKERFSNCVLRYF